MSDLVRTLETKYIYSTEQASERVKTLKGYVHVSMESQLNAKGQKMWRVVGYKIKGKEKGHAQKPTPAGEPMKRKQALRRGLFGKKVYK